MGILLDKVEMVVVVVEGGYKVVEQVPELM
jgi:hypothetical protein